MPAVPAAIRTGPAARPSRSLSHRVAFRMPRRPPRFRPAAPSSSRRPAARPAQAAPTAARSSCNCLRRERRDVIRPAQQLDVRMTPDDARRRARHVEQDPLEGSAVPPAGRFGGIAGRPASPTIPVAAGCRRFASGVRKRHRPRPAPQVQAAAPAGGRSCRRALRRHRECARPARGASRRAPSCAAAS